MSSRVMPKLVSNGVLRRILSLRRVTSSMCMDSQDSQDGSLFFFNDTATTEIYTLSLHDALPFFNSNSDGSGDLRGLTEQLDYLKWLGVEDRKSTRLNSSHVEISYAVFCLKK